MLSVVLLAQTELHQLLKLPALISHYLEHKAHNPTIGLGGFLVLHYLQTPIHDDDYERDMQLPFKANDCMTLQVHTTAPIIASLDLQHPQADYEITHNGYYRCFVPTPGAAEIWQPPKI